MTLEVVLVTPQKILFEGRVKRVIFPGERGVFEVLPFHKPCLSRLVGGNLIIDERTFSIRRGIMGFSLNKATIIVEE